jgi:hypothetical protein
MSESVSIHFENMKENEQARFEQGFGLLIVYIEYRVKGREGEPPSDKLLRARVKQRTAQGFSYGKDLVAPRKISNVSDARTICIDKLTKYCHYIRFEFDPLMECGSITLPAKKWL